LNQFRNAIPEKAYFSGSEIKHVCRQFDDAKLHAVRRQRRAVVGGLILKRFFRRGDCRARENFLTAIASSYNGKRFVIRRCITSQMDRVRAGCRSAREIFQNRNGTIQNFGLSRNSHRHEMNAA
jgi:hypothetical protein